MLGFAVLVPPLYAVVRGTPLYDGLRHFLFLVPPVCVVGALSLEAGLARLARHHHALPLVALAAMTFACIDQIRIMAQLHPHEYVFHNRFVGGLAGAAGCYDLDYYGSSHREAIAALLAHLRRTEPKDYLERPYRISACVPAAMLTPFLPPSFATVREQDDADFHIGYRRKHCAALFEDAPIVHEVRRFDTMLGVVRDRRASED
jgi:hypothetical protein